MTNTTLKKISEMLGISVSTVSRALKDHPDISTKTKVRVKELADTLEYEPNANAINLRTSKSNLFGLIVPSISNYFYESFISSVEEESRRKNFGLMILQSGDNVSIEIENLKHCRQSRVSGLFICLTINTVNLDAFSRFREMEIPVIFFDKVPDEQNTNRVCVADAVSATIAANAINEKRKKKVLAIFGNPNLSITKKRLFAFQKALEKEISLTSVFAGSAAEAEELTLHALLHDKPDTVFCMSDEILTGTMKAIQVSRQRVHEDIAVISISNGFIPKLYYPEITYAETSGYKLGKLAFSSMMACLAGSTFVQDLTIESQLVPGGSL